MHHVLEEIGGLNKPMMYVFNKIDDPSGARSAKRLLCRFPNAAAVSMLVKHGDVVRWDCRMFKRANRRTTAFGSTREGQLLSIASGHGA